MNQEPRTVAISVNILEQLKKYKKQGMYTVWGEFGEGTVKIGEILKRGVVFTGRIPLRSIPGIANIKLPGFVEQGCFLNAQELARVASKSGVVYCEGFSGRPFGGSLHVIEHAWCVYNNQVVDPTLELLEKQFGKPRQPDQYLGIEIPGEKVLITGRPLTASGVFKI
ncbi:MAG: hypothetical protein KGH64_04655 [Candidatus Micrarchaeota archaeon]|nr:hypothetical protein [Candidatus Micrarchaeota archaeon]MDE1834603.1 hypothetical protein [Candidatus Micrarchaeota archaeon]